MSSPSYELAGPFSESAKSAKESAHHVESFTVKLRAERNATHPLNPVGQLRRVVSGHHVVQDAILLLGLQFFEIFTVVHERSDTPQRSRGVKIKKRIVHAATSHLPKRLRREHEYEDGYELQTLPSGMSEADLGNVQDILKDHVFSCGVAFAQVVRIRSSGKSITVFYHPNSMKAAKLSSNYLTTALRFTFCLETLEETTKLLKELERRMSRYTQAALFLGEEWVMPSAMHIVAVTRPVPEGGSGEQQCGELLLQKDPPWGTTISAPASWGSEATGSQTPLWVFLMTPLGYGKCEISPAVVSLYRKGKEASFYVGVRHPQVSGSALATVSQLSQIRPTDSASDIESLDGDDSDDSWQPADAEESFSSPSQGATLPKSSNYNRSGSVSLQKSSAASEAGFKVAGMVSRSKAPSSHGIGGKHVRVHCVAKYVEPGTATRRYTATSTAGGLLPLHLPLDNRELLGLAMLLGLLLWLSQSWMQLLLWLGLQLFLLRYLRPAGTVIEGKPSPLMGATSAVGTLSGRWQISVLRAEIVTDEPWSAAGESILAQVETDEGEESAEARKQRLADEYGFSEDHVQRFLLAFHGDEVVAHRKMHATYEWRLANDIQGILRQPQPHFHFFKGMFRHGLLGVTRGGHPIWFMKVGDMKPGFKAFKDSGLTSRHLARHIAFCMEYMYTVVESSPLPNGRALWVLDLKGMGLTDMGSDAFDMGKEIAGLISAHWPERLYRSFIINMPGFFSILWRLVEPMMAASTRKKIRLLRGKQEMLKEMLEEMEEEDIPAEYGGKLEGDVYSSQKEQELWRYVSEIGYQTS